MTDIVAELRQRHRNTTGLDPRITNPIVGPTIFLEAADEIERLRTECTRLAQRNAVLVCEIDQMRQSFRVMEKLADILNSEADSEVKQLRNALYRGEG